MSAEHGRTPSDLRLGAQAHLMSSERANRLPLTISLAQAEFPEFGVVSGTTCPPTTPSSASGTTESGV